MQASRTDKMVRKRPSKKPVNKADYTRRERQAERDMKEQYITAYTEEIE